MLVVLRHGRQDGGRETHHPIYPSTQQKTSPLTDSHPPSKPRTHDENATNRQAGRQADRVDASMHWEGMQTHTHATTACVAAASLPPCLSPLCLSALLRCGCIHPSSRLSCGWWSDPASNPAGTNPSRGTR
mmetsp:Transcript_7366/g.17978  ORF Transcript_7366/g.17978 Transcript_7366/m.17978 type:complete len:131 (-) Transcript_7366:303-695(-)